MLVSDTPGVDAMQGHTPLEGNRTTYAGLKKSCGEPPHPRWLLPLAPPGGFYSEDGSVEKKGR